MKYKPMLAHAGHKKDLNRSNFIFEPKLDGIRALCFVNKTMKFYTRNALNITAQFPEFDFRSAFNARSCVLDGEIVVYDKKGHPSFALLQQRGQLPAITATYVVFDILEKNDNPLLSKPLFERKKLLENLIDPHPHLELIFFTGNGKALMQEMIKRKLEGVMAKDTSSTYRPGQRTYSWLKIKLHSSIDAVIIGFTQERRNVSSLALGLYDTQGQLHYIGKVGTGFTQSFLDQLYPQLNKLIVKKSPVVQSESLKKILWVKPTLVGEINYLELTKAGRLRTPVFLHLRKDKKPKECTFEGFVN